MKKRLLVLGSAFILIFLFCFSTMGGAFECDGKFIKVGSYRDEVFRRCGPPSSSDTWQEERIAEGYGSDPYRPYSYARTVLVTLERWTYNLGPNRFMQILTFQDAKLIRIQSGSTGY